MSVRLRGLIRLHKKCGLAAASAFLALVLLLTFVNFTQCQVPGQPTLVWPDNNENISDNIPNLEWDPVTGANNYDVQVDDNFDYSSPEVNADNIGADENYQILDENTLSDGVYYWHVRAENENGIGSWSENWIFRVDTLGPAAPAITAPASGENLSDNTPDISWSAVSENSSPVLYRVWIDNNSNFSTPENDSGWINVLTYTSGYLQDNLYYLRVAAKDNAGNQGENSERTFRVDTLVPIGPTLASPDDGAQTADSTPTLSWNTVSDNSLPVTYYLQVDDDSGFSSPTENVSGITNNSYITSSSLADGTWHWRVQARDNAGNVGNWSSSRSFIVDTAALAAPALTAPANGAITNDSTPTCDWESVSGAASYTLQYATDSGFTQNLTTGSSTASDYTPTTTLADGTWYWRVQTVDAVGNTGSWSSTWSFTIDTATPTVTISPSLGATLTATGWTLNTTNSSIEISGSVRDATSVTVKIDDKVATVVDDSFRKTIDLMVLGTNTFTIAVTDAAGNTTTRTLSVIRAGVEPPPVAEPAISSEQAVFIVALVALFIVLMVFVKTALVKKY